MKKGFAPILIIGIVLTLSIVGFIIYATYIDPFRDGYKIPPDVHEPSPPTTQTTDKTDYSDDETANWKTYTAKVIPLSLMLPTDFEVIEDPGIDLDDPRGLSNKKVTIKNNILSLTITDNFFGGYAGVQSVESKEIFIDNVLFSINYMKQGDPTEDPSTYDPSPVVMIGEKKSDHLFLIYANWEKENYVQAKNLIENILPTIKFLN